MTKLPFIPLYVNDWSRDLEEHPLEIEGAWFRIICKLWWEGGTGEAIKPIEAWAKILRTDTINAKRILDYLMDGKIGDISYFGYANGMAKVACRRMKRDWDIRQERSVAGAMGAKARWQKDGKAHGKPHGKRMKYDICNMKSESDIKNKKENLNPIDQRLTQLLIDLMQKNNPESSTLKHLTEKKQIDWMNQCRLLRETDNRTEADIEKVIRFSQGDSFWQKNILSMPKLREKWDQLWMKAGRTDGWDQDAWVKGMEKRLEEKKNGTI